jgi:hypothetical protein
MPQRKAYKHISPPLDLSLHDSSNFTSQTQNPSHQSTICNLFQAFHVEYISSSSKLFNLQPNLTPGSATMSSTKAIPLLGEQATTRNPPDVSSKTHIIALCGTSEIQSEASPRKDGWMVADFFLWKAILKGMGASQTWMTCLDPRKLIEKYESQYPDGLYLQGDPYEENRAVMLSRARLDSAMENLVMVDDTGSTLLRDSS